MEKFFEEIKNLIPNDYDEFLKCYNEEPYKGLRVNTLKCTGEKLQSLLDFPLKKTPFCDNGYYYPTKKKDLGKIHFIMQVLSIFKNHQPLRQYLCLV